MNINRERLREVLAASESCKLVRHEVQGIEHIGWGMNLETRWADAWLKHLCVEHEDDIQEITREQADWLFERAIDVAESDAKDLYVDVWGKLSALRREVLVNLLYNLGASRIRLFRRMNAAIARLDYETASSEMLDSKAARQTGDRYRKLANVMRHDDENFFELFPSWASWADDDRVRTEMLGTSSHTATEMLETSSAQASFDGVSDAALLSELSRRLERTRYSI